MNEVCIAADLFLFLFLPDLTDESGLNYLLFCLFFFYLWRILHIPLSIFVSLNPLVMDLDNELRTSKTDPSFIICK